MLIHSVEVVLVKKSRLSGMEVTWKYVLLRSRLVGLISCDEFPGDFLFQPPGEGRAISDLLHLKVLEPADFQETLYLAKMRSPRKRLTDLCHNALNSLFVFSLT